MILAACCLSSVSLFTSCDDYDDTELWNKVNGLEERIAALEEWQKTTDNNLNALQTLINTMDYITSVAPIMQANDTIGYTINFHQSNPISIYNGTTSQIGITQDEEGNWLWTLDGEILTTPDGTPIPANGQDAAAPQLSTGKALQDEGIKTDAAGDAIIADIAYLSVDEGETWYRVTGEKGDKGEQGDKGNTGSRGPAGADGDSFFQDVKIVENNVIFTLADGTTFTIAKYNGALTFMQNGTALDLTATIDLADGTLTYAPSDAEVSARIIDGEGWSASAAKGTITVNAGSIDENAEATLEITLLENGRVIETYRLTIEQTGLQGEGTAASPYLVSSPSELAYIAKQVNESEYTDYPYGGEYIQLTQDIDLTGMEWTPIGLDDLVEYLPAFCGTFDGNNHTIKGMSISKDGTESTAIGLFGLVNSGTIKNVILESPTITGGRRHTGFIVGSLLYGNIENCRVINGTMNCSESGTMHVGGIAGYLNNGSGRNSRVLNCHVENTTINSEVSEGGVTGGIVAFVAMGNTVSVTACSFEGTITSQKKETAGIVAVSYLNNGTNGNLEITGCYSSGTITSNEGSLIGTGGIIGHIYAGNTMVKASYSTMNITSVKTSGGVIGHYSPGDTDPDVFANACYWSGTGPEHGIGRIYKNGGTQSPDSEKEGATDKNAAKVTGTDDNTWSAALTAMNTALNGTGWEYAENTDPDTMASVPLTLKEQ